MSKYSKNWPTADFSIQNRSKPHGAIPVRLLFCQRWRPSVPKRSRIYDVCSGQIGRSPFFLHGGQRKEQRTPVKRCPAQGAGQGEFSVFRSFFLPFLFFRNRRAATVPPDLSVLKDNASLRSGLIVSDFSGRPGPRAQQDDPKKSPPRIGPCGSRVYGSYFFESSRFQVWDGAEF